MQREETTAYCNLMHFEMHFQNKPNVRNAWGLRDQLHGAQSVLKQNKFAYLMTSLPKFI